MSEFGENRFAKRSPLAQRIAIMGYLFGLARQIDPKLRYTMDISTLIGLIYIGKCSLSLFTSIVNGKLFLIHLKFINFDSSSLANLLAIRLKFSFFF